MVGFFMQLFSIIPLKNCLPLLWVSAPLQLLQCGARLRPMLPRRRWAHTASQPFQFTLFTPKINPYLLTEQHPLPTEPFGTTQGQGGSFHLPSPGEQYFYCQPQIWGPVELNEDKAPNFEPTIQLGFAQMQLQTAFVKICPAN